MQSSGRNASSRTAPSDVPGRLLAHGGWISQEHGSGGTVVGHPAGRIQGRHALADALVVWIGWNWKAPLKSVIKRL